MESWPTFVSTLLIELIDEYGIFHLQEDELNSYSFFSAPSIGGSVHESHPFSIANLPNPDGELVFLIRAHNGKLSALTNREWERIAYPFSRFYSKTYRSYPLITTYLSRRSIRSLPYSEPLSLHPPHIWWNRRYLRPIPFPRYNLRYPVRTRMHEASQIGLARQTCGRRLVDY